MKYTVGILLCLVLASCSSFQTQEPSIASESTTRKVQTPYPAPVSTADLKGIAYSEKGVYVAVGFMGEILNSADGITWNKVQSGTDKGLWGIVWGRNRFVAVGDQGTVLLSENGESWEAVKSGTNSCIQRIIWDGKQYVAISFGSILVSIDGRKWSVKEFPDAALNNNTDRGYSYSMSSVLWDGKKYITAGSGNSILSSADLNKWQINVSHSLGTGMFFDLAWSGKRYVAVGDHLALMVSEDGINWVDKGLKIDMIERVDDYYTLYISGVVWGGNKFVAVGQKGIILASADGMAWTPAPRITRSVLSQIIWDGNKYIAVGDAGTIITSNDALKWNKLYPKSLAPLEEGFNPEQSKKAFERVRKLAAEGRKTIVEPWRIQYPDTAGERYLFIKPKNEADFYLAEEKFFNAFRYILDWAEEYAAENSDKEIYDEYDFTIRTSDSHDIHYNSKTNIFYFENNRKLYKLWSEKDNLWTSLRFDKNNASVDFTQEGLILDTAELHEDLDGDKIYENIFLRRNIDMDYSGISPVLSIVIGDKEEVLFDNAQSGIRTKPVINMLRSVDNETKAAIVSSAIKPADWAPYEEFYPYEYKADKLLKLSVERPDKKVKVSGRRVDVGYPEFGKKISFTVNDNTIRFYGEPKELFSKEVPLHLRSVEFGQNNSGMQTLVTKENAELFKGGYFYTQKTGYVLKEGKLIPVYLELTKSGNP
ncbi:MAG: hypothetical protein N3I35_19205 [Clostridia bacterium]|nr:hypothetical protein [Clostridia bacterium]